VFRNGSLIQHIPDFLPEKTRALVNHEAGKAVAVAHEVAIERGSMLAEILRGGDDKLQAQPKIVIPVNSSHHQSAKTIGDGLRVVAHCTADGIIEALEGTAPDHFVLAVQWHPERSVQDGRDVADPAEKIFRAFIEAAREKCGSGAGVE
jgi:putative glutamine amidotransferase